MIKHKKSLFIFHRDLRLEDNTTLHKALECSEEVIPCFIFTRDQFFENPLSNSFAIECMLTSLKELHDALKKRNSQLYIFKGDQVAVLDTLRKEIPFTAVFENKDYTPYAKQREDKTNAFCKEQGISYFSLHDALLNPPLKILKKDATPYTVFTPFYKYAKTFSVSKPVLELQGTFYKQTISSSVPLDSISYKKNSLIVCKGGRKEGLEIISSMSSHKNYSQERDFPYKSATTLLSVHNKFGTLSIREVYHAIKETFSEDHDLIRQLYWRDFFYHIASHYPFVFERAFLDKFTDISWNLNEEWFELWCEGKTGFPIVDAGMRELNKTGYMHNRVRMIVASFLTKDLHIDWKKGERYFAQKLVDYDPCVNNGSWQWAASTGCDAQPYFRIFNPWRQQERFDPDCLYIKKWIPELKDIPTKTIHSVELLLKLDSTYPKPIVDHHVQKEIALQLYNKK